MVRRSSVEALPGEVRAWLDRSLVDGNFSGYAALEEELRGRGFEISRSAIHRYGQPLQRRLAAIKASTEAARLITEGAADDADARSEAVIALIQTELFESIVSLQEAASEDADPIERMNALSSVAKNVATLSRASVNLKKFQSDLREKVDAKLRAMQAEAEAADRQPGGLDPDTLRRVREEIYGIVG